MISSVWSMLLIKTAMFTRYLYSLLNIIIVINLNKIRKILLAFMRQSSSQRVSKPHGSKIKEHSVLSSLTLYWLS